MDTLPLRFLRPNTRFYDDPSRYPPPRSERVYPDATVPWQSWRSTQHGPWCSWLPPENALPDQGWKIHVSPLGRDAREVLRITSAYCHRNHLAFKHLRSLTDLFEINAKEAERAHSGKFITIYPRSTEQLRQTLEHLGTALQGFEGPEVLTDLRWRDTPLHVRYGAFALLHTEDGTGLPALRSPGGNLVPDRREPQFSPPSWVTLPEFLQEQVEVDVGPPEGFPYTITAALKHSNAGGVYLADAENGGRVVVKHARPHAGWTPDGRVAVDRLVDEQRALNALAGEGIVVFQGSWKHQGHYFLATEFVAGTQLSTALSIRCPLIRAGSSQAQYAEYRNWVSDVITQISRTLDQIHNAGWVFGDLHPKNVIIVDDDAETRRAVLVDFEMAHPVEDSLPVIVGAPGFRSPDTSLQRTQYGYGADRYALAALNLYLFLPLPALIELDPRKAQEYIAYAKEMYTLDDIWAHEISEALGVEEEHINGVAPELRGSARQADTVIRNWSTDNTDGLFNIQVMISRSLETSAEYDRNDLIWPGDPRQFSDGGFGLAHGAAGVIHAQLATRCEVNPLSLDWLRDTAHQLIEKDASPKLGLYDGAAGLAWILRYLGEHTLANQLNETVIAAVASDFERLGTDLYGGLAGIGLYLLEESHQAPNKTLATKSRELAENIADRLELRHRKLGSKPGLMWGPSGEALFLLRMSMDGNHGLLDATERLIAEDLRACISARDGSLQLEDGKRVLPYLAHGSAGIGLVAAQFAAYTDGRNQYEDEIRAIALAASATFCIEPGLFRGRAGLMHVLDAFGRLGFDSPDQSRALSMHADALRLHALRHGPGIAFPGEWLLRLSCDLATGSAGVLLVLQQRYDAQSEANEPTESLIPFLTPSSQLLLSSRF